MDLYGLRLLWTGLDLRWLDRADNRIVFAHMKRKGGFAEKGKYARPWLISCLAIFLRLSMRDD